MIRAPVGLLMSVSLGVQSVGATCTQQSAFTFKAEKSNEISVEQIKVPSYSGTILHYQASQKINADGAPTAYAVDPENPDALDTICNGANAYLDEATKIEGALTDDEKDRLADEGNSEYEIHAINVKLCNGLKFAYNKARDQLFDLVRYPRMDFFSVATPSDTRSDGPCAPRDGFFTSTTDLPADPSLSPCNPDHWLDSTRYAAIVIPRNSEFISRPEYQIVSGVLVFARQGMTWKLAVVGDIGPPRGLGEMTIKLGWELNGKGYDTRSMTPAAIKAVMKDADVDGLVDYYLLVNSSVALPADRLTTKAKGSFKVSPAAIESAFSKLNVGAIQADTLSCH